MTSANKQMIKNILSLPDAPAIVKEVDDILKDEKKRRQDFYNDMTDEHKVEFINGEIIIHSPVKKEHNDASGNLYQLIGPFVKKNKLGYVGYEKIMITLSRNDYEPDICFFNKEKSKYFKKGQSLFPAPDVVVEVLSKGTKKNDRGIKFNDYQAHNVHEYWIIDPIKEVVEQYRLDVDGEYELILKASNGWLYSEVIQDFNILIESIFDEELNLKELVRLLENN